MSGWKLLVGALIAGVISVAVPQPLRAQKGMTLEEYLVLQERVDAFCNYYDELERTRQPLKDGTVYVPGRGKGIFYVYTASEVQALLRHCFALGKLMVKVKG